MEEDHSKKDDNQAAQHLPPSTPVVNTDDRAKQPKESNPKTNQAKKNEKWSFHRHWDNASKIKRAEWMGGAVLGLVALIYYGTQIYQTIWGTIQSEKHYAAEHRPQLIFSRPPKISGTCECAVGNNAVWMHVGATEVYVKNIGNEDALSAFIAGPIPTLLPEPKTGDKFIDTQTVITDKSCEVPLSKADRFFPVHRREEVTEFIRQVAGGFSLIDAKQFTITFGGPQKEPEPTPGENPHRVNLAADTKFTLWFPACVYYTDSSGKSFGTCRTYRFLVSGRPEGSDNGVFSCQQSPLQGTLIEAISGYCEE